MTFKIYFIPLFLSFYITCLHAQDSLYKLGPDSYTKEGVPKGTITKMALQACHLAPYAHSRLPGKDRIIFIKF